MTDEEWLDSLTDEQFDAVLGDRRRAHEEAITSAACIDAVAFARERLNTASRRAGARIDRLREQISSLERHTS